MRDELKSETVWNLHHRQPVMLPAQALLSEVVAALREHHRGAVLVLDEEKALMGIFTERDLLLLVASDGEDAMARRLGEVASTNLVLVKNDTTLAEALALMNSRGLRHLPMVDPQGGPLGIVSIRDILAWLVDNHPQEFLNLPGR
jgi:CBS domain-containing protein